MTDVLLTLVVLLQGAALVLLYLLFSRRAADHAADFAELKARAAADAEQARATERTLREELARNRDEQARTVAGLREELTRTLHERHESARAEQARGAAEALAKSESVRVAVTDALRAQADTLAGRLDAFGGALRESLAKTDSEASRRAESLAKLVSEALSGQSDSLSRRLDALAASQRAALEELARGNAERLERLRETLDRNLAELRAANDAKLDAMRATVDEKLAATLEGRLGETFRQVSERLDNVQRSFGEMQKMAGDVGDLKRVMTNVKTRGVLGEYVLASLVEQVLTPDQYEKNWRPKKRGAASQDAVEIAVKLPGAAEGEPVFLPVDAKFPKEDFEAILAAGERADAPALEAARKALAARVESFAADIRDKYVNPPATTDFAVLFLPAEGLYAEVLNNPALVERLQRMKITVAGPTTLLALLNSLHMGFRTLAIQKKSAEVWKTLQAVKTQVGSFGELLVAVQEKLDAASKTVGRAADRHRIMTDRLKKVESLPAAEAALVLEEATGEENAG